VRVDVKHCPERPKKRFFRADFFLALRTKKEKTAEEGLKGRKNKPNEL